METTKARTNDENKEASKGKWSYISTITSGAPRSNLPSKGTMKRKIVEMLIVHKKYDGTSIKTHDRSMLELWDFEKVETF